MTIHKTPRLLLVVSALFLAQCMDQEPLAPLGGPGAERPAAKASLLTCRGSAQTGTISCTSESAGSFLSVGSSPLLSANPAFSASVTAAVGGSIIVGGQNSFVKLTSSNITTSGGEFAFDVTLQNLIAQAMGTYDGTTLAPEGIRVFFYEEPVVVSGGGTISIGNADGTGTFTSASQPYYVYSAVLDPNEVSEVKRWVFPYTGTPVFEFSVFVWAPVQYPDGWVIVTPSSDQLEIPTDPDVQLSGSVVDAIGRTVSSPPAIVWSSSNEAVATVDNTGLVTAAGPGSTTITATAGTYIGTSAITVIGAVDHFVVEATAGGNIGTQASGVAFNIKITAQDAANQTVTDFTGTVDLSSTPAGLSVTSGAFTAGVLASQSVTIASGGNYTITATRTAGSEAGTSNAFDVTAVAGAVADDVSGSSAPNDPYHTPLNTALSIPDGAQDLLANDNRGFPLANVSHFGGIQCNNGDGTGTLSAVTDAGVTANTAGSTIANLNGIGGCTGGSLTVNADGTLTFTPTATYTGLFRFQYRITNSAGTSDAQVTLAVGIRPSANSTTYAPTLLGNVPINTATSTNTLVDASGDQLFFTVTANTNGTGAVASNKTYSFAPAIGFGDGAANFKFKAKNGFGESAEQTVTFAVGPRVWFVQAGAAAGGDGRPATPFNCLVGTNCFDDSANGVNDRIHVASGTYTDDAALVLKDGQRLIGQAASADFATTSGLTWPADAGTAPASGGAAVNINTTVGNVITLGSGNTLRGLTLGNAAAGGASIAGTDFGTLTVANDVSINTNTQALNLLTGTIAGDLGGVTSSGGTRNISLGVISGTTNLGGGALSGATERAFAVGGGDGSITYSGTISSAGTARPATIQNKTSGGVTLSGSINATGLGLLVSGNSGGSYTFSNASKSLNTGANDAITLLNNTGATINFSGGGLAIITTSGRGLRASGGGTLSVGTGGSSNTISIGTGESALWLTDMTVGGDDITFATISGTGTTTGSPLCIQSTTGSANETINVGTLSIAGTSGGPGVCLESSSAPVTIGTATINNTATAGIQITSYTAAVSVNGGNIGNTNDPTGDAVNITGGTGPVTIAASVTKNGAGGNEVVDISGHGTGAISFTGAISSSNGSGGIRIVNNSSGTIDFSGDVTLNTATLNGINFTNTGGTGATVTLSEGSLSVVTTSGTGINATNSTAGAGSLTISGASNTVAASTGRAINVDGVTLNATLLSVGVSGGGTTTGVFLKNTGSGGAFVVTGTGSVAGSGGIITSIGGGDLGVDGSGRASLAATTGTGIYMENVSNVSLSNMFFGTVATTMNNFGIRGENVNNFTLRDSGFRGTFGTNEGQDEGAIRFGTENNTSVTGLRGTALFEGNNIAGGYENNLSVFLYGANTLNITVQDNGTSGDQAVFGLNGTALGDDSFHIESGSTSNLTLTVNGVVFNGARGDQLQTIAIGNTTQTLTITNNDFLNSHSNIVSGGGGVTLLGGDTGAGSNVNITYNFSSNNIKGAKGDALRTIYTGTAGTLSGVIANNQIGTDNNVLDLNANGGSIAGGSGINAGSVRSSGTGSLTHAVRISGNGVRDIQNAFGGIILTSNMAGTTGTSRLEATLLNNIVEEVGGDVLAGLYAIVGGQSSAANSLDAAKMGLNINGNTFTAGPTTGGAAILFDQLSGNAQYYFPGYTVTANSSHGEFRGGAGGTASSSLDAFLDPGNNLINGPFPTIAGQQVDANQTVNIGNQAFVLTVP